MLDLDGVVNRAGVAISGAAVDTTKEGIDAILDVNLKAAINLMQVVCTKMVLSDKGGSVVNISNVERTVAKDNFMASCGAKAGLGVCL